MIGFGLFPVSILLQTISISFSRLNFFVSKNEMKRLIGIEGELWYAEDGVLNRAAAEYELEISPFVNELYFSWSNKEKSPIPYAIELVYEPNPPTSSPMESLSSIPLNGNLEPTNDASTFFIRLPHCEKSQQSDVKLRIKITWSWPSTDNRTSLDLRRRKLCSKYSEPDGIDDANSRDDSEGISTEGLEKDDISIASSFLGSATNLFYVSMGFLFGFTVITASLIILYFAKVDEGSSCCGSAGRASKGSNQDADDARSSLLHPTSKNQVVSSTPLDINAMAALQNVRRECGSNSSLSGIDSGQQNRQSANQSILSNQGGAASFKGRNASLQRQSEQRQAEVSSVIPQAAPRVLYFEDNDQLDIDGIVDRLKVDSDAVELGPVLLEGTFGEVLLGRLKVEDRQSRIEKEGRSDEEDFDIIVKRLKDEASSQQLHRFLAESLRFADLLPQANVCLPVAVSRTDDTDLIDSQSIRYSICFVHDGFGNLKKFLLRCRGSDAPGNGLEPPPMILSTQDLVYVALQIIRGLLHLHKFGLLHRDVATRNCLVGRDLAIQLCDTGLSRDLFPQDYHCLGDNENRPIKWLSLESLERSEFSTASDVWAFGVALWELTTLAQQPYADVDPFEMHTYLTADHRLSQPYNCPDELYLLMYCCWNLHPEARPTFGQLLAALEHFYAQLTQYI